jgi:pilus assembly protein CpaE
MEDTIHITPDHLRRVIALLKATFTHLVIDLSKSYGPLDLAAMETSNAVLIVTQLDLPCLRNVVRLMQFFDQREGLSEKIKVIVNRQTIGRDIFWQIPNDYATMVESRNNGVPLAVEAPRAKLTKSIEQLAKAIDHGHEAEPETDDRKGKKGLFRFLGSNTK